METISLRRYLDEGNRLEDAGVDLEMFAEHAILDRITLTPEHRRRNAAGSREALGVLLTDYPHVVDEARWRRFAWEAELASDDALCERVETMLPADLQAEHRAHAYIALRPFRLIVDDGPAHWTCGACGTEQDGGPRLRIADDGLALDDETVFLGDREMMLCASCIEITREAMRVQPTA